MRFSMVGYQSLSPALPKVFCNRIRYEWAFSSASSSRSAATLVSCQLSQPSSTSRAIRLRVFSTRQRPRRQDDHASGSESEGLAEGGLGSFLALHRFLGARLGLLDQGLDGVALLRADELLLAAAHQEVFDAGPQIGQALAGLGGDVL